MLEPERRRSRHATENAGKTAETTTTETKTTNAKAKTTEEKTNHTKMSEEKTRETKTADAETNKVKTTGSSMPRHHMNLKEFMRDSATINRSIEPYCVL
jgi:uncharacterized phage infection (PIP) family protein YhgE